ncbi:MAG: ATP-binding protein [Fusobacteriota bacterium]
MKISNKIRYAFITLSMIGIGIIMISNYSRIHIEKSKQGVETGIEKSKDNFEKYSNVLKLNELYNSILSNILILGYIDNMDRFEEVKLEYKKNLNEIQNLAVEFTYEDNLVGLIFGIDSKIQNVFRLKQEELDLKKASSNTSYKLNIEKLRLEERELKEKMKLNINQNNSFYEKIIEKYKGDTPKKDIDLLNKNNMNNLSILGIEKIWESNLEYILENFPNYRKLKLYNQQIYMDHIRFSEYKDVVEKELDLIEKNLPLFYSFTKVEDIDRNLLDQTIDAFKKKLEKINNLNNDITEVQNEMSELINKMEEKELEIGTFRKNALQILNSIFNHEIKKIESLIGKTSNQQKTQMIKNFSNIEIRLIENVETLKNVNIGIFGLVLFNLLILYIIFYFVMSKSVIKPLNYLESEMKDIKHDNFDKKIEVIDADDEIGDLTKAINIMLSQMSNLYKQLAGQKKALERRVQGRTVELAKVNKDLNESLEKLKKTQKKLIETEKMASLGGLVAGVAHEVNTPVGVGVSAASYLKDETNKIKKKYDDEEMTQDDFEEYLKNALDSSEIILKNLNKASNQIKNFKKVAIDQTSEVKREFKIKDYIEDVVSSLYHELKQKSHTVDVIGDDVTLNSYPGVFSQIISNLIMNSIIHGFENKKGGKIEIKIEEIRKKKGNKIKIIYTDNGKGIEEEDTDKIFEPFFTTKRGEGGSGLGMHILYNLVNHKLDGEVEVLSKKGEGVKFIISIPV